MTDEDEAKLRRENEAVLRDLGYVPGIEVAPRRVDFNLVFANAATRSSAKAGVTELGFMWAEEVDAVEPGTAEATAYCRAQPTVDLITAAEISLSKLIGPMGGYVDGWGFLGDTEH